MKNRREKYLDQDDLRLSVLNDESLHDWCLAEGGNVRRFVQKHAAELRRLINERLDNPAKLHRPV